MNESDTRLHKIDPMLKAAGWGTTEGSRITTEYTFTRGKISRSLKFGSVPEGISALGGAPVARQVFKDFQYHLYNDHQDTKVNFGY